MIGEGSFGRGFKRDVFDCIDMFYNPKRKRAGNGALSPAAFERQQEISNEGAWNIRCYPDICCMPSLFATPETGGNNGKRDRNGTVRQAMDG